MNQTRDSLRRAYTLANTIDADRTIAEKDVRIAELRALVKEALELVEFNIGETGHPKNVVDDWRGRARKAVK